MATSTQAGIPGSELDDATLERELEHLHETRHHTFLTSSADALQTHTERMLELEAEYSRRFPKRTEPDPLRTREGSRELDGRGS
ncbi:MAG TPA: DUF6158 family protein [Frankiaceae bacterium]|nr:DUF6158 family protein [Frankiaceae bacterium]